jgi:hypothetical protein
VSEQRGERPVAGLREPPAEPLAEREPELLQLPSGSDAAIGSDVKWRKPA